MKYTKIIISTVIATTLANANTDISITAGVKDYTNSKTKTDGTTYNVGVGHNYNSSKVSFNYSKDSVDRVQPNTTSATTPLDVKKYNLNYKYTLDKALSLKASYIKILDNLAPTDQGKVYGLGANYKLNKGFVAGVSAYKSDYKQFNVNQYDLYVSKGFKIADRKVKLSAVMKSINIDGDKYSTYTSKDKSYFTTAIKLNAMCKNNFVLGLGMFTGDRMFAVLNDGEKVQHHAMEFNKTYMASFGKKFKNFDIIAKYANSKGDELPENRKDVTTKVTSLMFKYRF